MPAAPRDAAPVDDDDDITESTSESEASGGSSGSDGGEGTRKRKRRDGASPPSSLPPPPARPPPVLRWMRTPLFGDDDATSRVAVPLSRVLGLDPRIREHLKKELGFESLLPVQAAVWAASAGGGGGGGGGGGAAHDLAVSAPTGSGKTLAYGLPLLHSLLDEELGEGDGEEGEGRRRRRRRRRLGASLGALVVVPTRDLAEQVASVLGPAGERVGLRTALVVGGGGGGGAAPSSSPAGPRSYHRPRSFEEEREAIVGKRSLDNRRGWCGDYLSPSLAASEAESEGVPPSASDVVVATPGRLSAHLASLGPQLSRRALSSLRFLVVDEADRLLRQEYGGWAAALELATSNFNFPSSPLRRGRCVRVAASATLTRDPAKLARLRLWRPRFVSVGGGWGGDEKGKGEAERAAAERDERDKGALGADDDGGEIDEGEEDRLSSDSEDDEGEAATPDRRRQKERYALPPGLSLRRVDVGARGGANKPAALLALLRLLASRGQRSVVFCASVAGAKAVARFLENVTPPIELSTKGGGGEEKDGGRKPFVGLVASGAASSEQRQRSLRAFSSFDLPVLVCSDGATRGLDLGRGGDTAVVSYDPPAHAKALVHRAGRAVRGTTATTATAGGKPGPGGAGSSSGRVPEGVSGTAYTLLRPQDAAFHKELLRKVAGASSRSKPGGEKNKSVDAESPLSPEAAQRLLKAFKVPKASLKEARKQAEAAVAAMASSAKGGL